MKSLKNFNLASNILKKSKKKGGKPQRKKKTVESLADELLKFLNSTAVQRETRKLLQNYDSSELYSALRKETCNKNNDGMYELKIEPVEDKLWELTKRTFNKMPEDCMTINWPAGDYNTWGDLYDNDEHITYCYDIVTEKPYPYKGGYGDYEANEAYSRGESMAYSGSIYVCFIIPYLMAMKSLEDMPDQPPSTFMFVYRGGGAGVLVNESNRKGEPLAYTCAHTIHYDLANGPEEMNPEEKFLVMLTDGTLCLLGDLKLVNDDDGEIDIGVGTISTSENLSGMVADIVNLEGVQISNQRSRRGKSNNTNQGYSIFNIGAPSVINIKHNQYSSYSKPPLVQIPNTNRKDCIWDPLFFHLKEGKITNISDHTIEHDALVWEGMSGGPIYNPEGGLVGIHFRGDGLGMRADKIREIMTEYGFRL